MYYVIYIFYVRTNDVKLYFAEVCIVIEWNFVYSLFKENNGHFDLNREFSLQEYHLELFTSLDENFNLNLHLLCSVSSIFII